MTDAGKRARLALGLAVVVALAAHPPTGVAEDSFWTTLLRVTGISASPRQQRSGDGERVAGELWLVPATGGAKSRLTRSGRFHSPIFLPGDRSVLALQEDRLARVDVANGTVEDLGPLPGVVKLVGVTRGNPNELAVLSVAGGRLHVELLDRTSGRQTIVPHDLKNDQDRLMLAYVAGEERDYGGVRVFVEDQSTSYRQLTDVFIRREGQAAVNLTRGAGVNSRQPALSHDGRLVTYVNVGELP